jgi:eukaryotic-like serine/threonine-protein kinase
VHRDLKPANVMLTDDDRVKILDFGLARVAESSGDANLPNSPTITGATRAGVILGTAAYMSPEQAKGRTADKRSDVWSFGCVLYELLTGTSPFAGETISETLANVLKCEPDWSRLPATLPPAVRTCLEGCFRRDRHDRIGDMSTVKFLLSLPPGLGTGTGIAATTAGRGAARERAVWLAAAVTLAAVTGLIVWRMRPAPVDAGATARFHVVLPEGQEFGPGPRTTAISPDGKKIVYIANRQLYLRQMADPEARPIRGSAEDPITPVFSPDGEWVAYVDRSRSRIKKLPVAGGAPVMVAELPASPSGLTWSAGRIAFGLTSGETSGIQAVSDSGGAVKQLISVDPRTEVASQPQLVGDTHVLFTVRRLQLAGSAGGNSIVLQEINGGARSTLIENGTYDRVLENGLLTYLSQGSLRRGVRRSAPRRHRESRRAGPGRRGIHGGAKRHPGLQLCRCLLAGARRCSRSPSIS